MGDVAGILDLLILFFSFFTNSFVEHSYNLKMLGKVFMAKTKDPNVLMEKCATHSHYITKKI